MQFIPLVLAVAALVLGVWMMVRAWQLRFTGGMIGGIFFLTVAIYVFFIWWTQISFVSVSSTSTSLPRVIPTITPQP